MGDKHEKDELAFLDEKEPDNLPEPAKEKKRPKHDPNERQHEQ